MGIGLVRGSGMDRSGVPSSVRNYGIGGGLVTETPMRVAVLCLQCRGQHIIMEREGCSTVSEAQSISKPV